MAGIFSNLKHTPRADTLRPLIMLGGSVHGRQRPHSGVNGQTDQAACRGYFNMNNGVAPFSLSHPLDLEP